MVVRVLKHNLFFFSSIFLLLIGTEYLLCDDTFVIIMVISMLLFEVTTILTSQTKTFFSDTRNTIKASLLVHYLWKEEELSFSILEACRNNKLVYLASSLLSIINPSLLFKINPKLLSKITRKYASI